MWLNLMRQRVGRSLDLGESGQARSLVEFFSDEEEEERERVWNRYPVADLSKEQPLPDAELSWPTATVTSELPVWGGSARKENLGGPLYAGARKFRLAVRLG